MKKNPLIQIKNDKNWSIQDMSIACNVSTSTIYKNLEGSYFNVTDQVLEALGGMGYDKKGIKEKYQEFRKARREKLIS